MASGDSQVKEEGEDIMLSEISIRKRAKTIRFHLYVEYKMNEVTNKLTRQN